VFGLGGGTCSYQEITETDVILLWGSNAREAHPIFFHHLLRGLDSGAVMYAVDPRRTSSAEFADVWLGLDVGTDIALSNTVAREIIAQGMHNQSFIDHATTGFDAYAASVEPFTLEEGERLTDFQTADLNHKDTGWTTQGSPEGRAGGGGTYQGKHIRHRDYWADRIVLVALRLDPEHGNPGLDDIERALDGPCPL